MPQLNPNHYCTLGFCLLDVYKHVGEAPCVKKTTITSNELTALIRLERKRYEWMMGYNGVYDPVTYGISQPMFDTYQGL